MTTTTTAAPPLPACPDWCELEPDRHELELDRSHWLWTHEKWFGTQPETEHTRRHGGHHMPIVEVLLQEILDSDGRRPDADNIDLINIWIHAPEEVDTADHLRTVAAHLVEAAEFLDTHRLTGYWKHFAGMPYEEFRTNALPS